MSTLYGIYVPKLPGAPFKAKQVEPIDLIVEKFDAGDSQNPMSRSGRGELLVIADDSEVEHRGILQVLRHAELYVITHLYRLWRFAVVVAHPFAQMISVEIVCANGWASARSNFMTGER